MDGRDGRDGSDVVVTVGGGGGGLVGGGLVGKKKRYRPREQLKRYWATELWADLFDVLMNPGHWVEHGGGDEEGERQVGRPSRRLREVKERMEVWLVENAERKGLRAALRRAEERVNARRR